MAQPSAMKNQARVFPKPSGRTQRKQGLSGRYCRGVLFPWTRRSALVDTLPEKKFPGGGCWGIMFIMGGVYSIETYPPVFFIFYFLFFLFAHFYFSASGQAVVTGVIPSPSRFLPSIFIAHRVQQSHCSSIVHRVLLTHALALSASKFVHKKTST